MQLLIFLQPSINCYRWYDQFISQAVGLGFSVYLEEERNEEVRDTSDNVILVSSDGPRADKIMDNFDTIVVSDSPNNLFLSLLNSTELPDVFNSVRHASKVLAYSGTMVCRGARQVAVDGKDNSLTIAGIHISHTDFPPCPIHNDEISLASVLSANMSGQAQPHSLQNVDIRILETHDGSPYCGEWIQLSGRPKLIVAGPYTFHGPGEWKIRVEFAIDEVVNYVPLDIAWGSGDSSVPHEFIFDEAGVYCFEDLYSCDAISQLRLMVALSKPSFAGRIKITSVTVIELSES